MNTIILGVIAGVIVILVVVLIPLILEIRRTVAALRQTMEQQLNPALEELQTTLKSVKGITDNVRYHYGGRAQIFRRYPTGRPKDQYSQHRYRYSCLLPYHQDREPEGRDRYSVIISDC